MKPSPRLIGDYPAPPISFFMAKIADQSPPVKPLALTD
jgi:hypothetical protein